MRPVGAKREVTEQAIHTAGVELISTYGYEAMTLRMLAEKVNMKAGSLYNYFKTKQEFLAIVLKAVMRDLLMEFTERVDLQPTTLARFEAMVIVHIDFHTRRRQEVFIGNMELRSLDEENYKMVTRLRSEYERRVRQIVEEGVAEGVFQVTDCNLTSKALISMLTGICSWYDLNGRLTIDDLEKQHIELALRMVGYQTPQ
ncbi:TetR/AcrR family transcriptional regulator [Pseudomonas sp. v388]|uniref:TetR/AcrR family transcriptional regulator n=1 Tax=Pseudomonas sp. v388 TaxID=2479849 RepID=UPI000F79A0B5|nr:TetR/AcrR family transcriptional regulator [Pseudomonas sp. v388]RRV10511.1 TetR/AcrR family transcriptional regulator [Pseudomonas sp. v388]